MIYLTQIAVNPHHRLRPVPRPTAYCLNGCSTSAPPPPPPKPLLPQRDLVLHGVSQIGNKVNVILQTPDGKQYSQRIVNRTQRTAVDIEGYRDYALLEVKSRK
ncbi:MAG: hypothetical protein R3E08_01420 [Thiotrichaceae bacterium]